MVVTRAAEQAGPLVERLKALGADVVELPLISIAPPADGGAGLQAALAGLRDGEWLAVTSVNGVAAVLGLGLGERFSARSVPYAAPGAPGIPAGVRVAAVGPATAGALRAAEIEPALVPEEAVAESLADALGSVEPGRIVLAQAERARPVLAERLAAAGWEVVPVVAYRTTAAPVDPETLDRAATADAITFTSGSTVEAFVAAAGSDRVPQAVLCIGPVTATAARRHGLTVAAVADPHTAEGLVAAVTEALTRS